MGDPVWVALVLPLGQVPLLLGQTTLPLQEHFQLMMPRQTRLLGAPWSDSEGARESRSLHLPLEETNQTGREGGSHLFVSDLPTIDNLGSQKAIITIAQGFPHNGTTKAANLDWEVTKIACG